MGKWDKRIKPNLDQLIDLFRNPETAAFINGHLIIESLLVQLIDLKLQNPDDFDAYSVNFKAKVNLCSALGLFKQKVVSFLLEINSVRNKIAHSLGYELSFKEVFMLAQKAGEAGIDFSYETIYEDELKSEEWYGLDGVIQEIFQNTAMDLSFIMEEHGGKFQFF